MPLGVKNFYCVLSSVLYVMAALSAITAAQTGNRIMYIQTAICGLFGAGVIIAVLVRL